ncbi:MAG: alpha/beta hydrolase fold domain-containing protein [Anaerolineae bacterium]|jgi:acetyl esterase/lipase
MTLNQQLAEGVEIVRDVVYAQIGDRALAMDLYWHPGAGEPEPLVVWVHGGAWMSGDKTWMPPVSYLLDNGFAMASIDYRLSQEALFPAQIEDCKAAIRWLRANAARYNLNPDRVGAWGESAGGHLVALLGTAGGVAAWDQQGGNREYSSRVQAVCDWFGPSDLLQMGVMKSGLDHDAPDAPEALLIGGPVQENKEKASQANPITYITPESPPFFIIHGAQDDVVPLGQSELLHRALVEAGLDSTLMIIPGMGHGVMELAETRWAELQRSVVDFFERTLG